MVIRLSFYLCICSLSDVSQLPSKRMHPSSSCIYFQVGSWYMYSGRKLIPTSIQVCLHGTEAPGISGTRQRDPGVHLPLTKHGTHHVLLLFALFLQFPTSFRHLARGTNGPS